MSCHGDAGLRVTSAGFFGWRSRRCERIATVLGVMFSLILLYADFAGAQVRPWEPFWIQAKHDGLKTDEYRLLRDGAVSSARSIGDLVDGVVTLDSPGLPEGSYQFVVSATGPDGQSFSQPILVSVSNSAPVTAPADTEAPSVSFAGVVKSRKSYNVTITVDARDNVRVAQVDLLEGSKVRGSVKVAPYVFTVGVKRSTTFTARAVDTAGNEATVSLQVTR